MFFFLLHLTNQVVYYLRSYTPSFTYVNQGTYNLNTLPPINTTQHRDGSVSVLGRTPAYGLHESYLSASITN